MEKFRVVLITQARTGSSRLPGKVLLDLGGEPLLLVHLKRITQTKSIDKIIVATTDSDADKAIIQLCSDNQYNYFAGSENDVLDRFYQSVKAEQADWIVRVTSDCPLVDPRLIDAVVDCAIVNDADYCSNGLIENFPDGQDIEVFKFSALEDAWNNAQRRSEREHVTPYMRTATLQNFIHVNFPCRADYSQVRMTVDEAVDLAVVNDMVQALGKKATWLEYTNYLLKSDVSKLNSGIIRNEGYIKSLKND